MNKLHLNRTLCNTFQYIINLDAEQTVLIPEWLDLMACDMLASTISEEKSNKLFSILKSSIRKDFGSGALKYVLKAS